MYVLRRHIGKREGAGGGWQRQRRRADHRGGGGGGRINFDGEISASIRCRPDERIKAIWMLIKGSNDVDAGDV